jgi:uncharacterized protein (DUF2132 family)
MQDAINANPAHGCVLEDVLNGHVQPFGIRLAVQLAIDCFSSGGI